ncbi:hypothetical protein [Bradyrhizobium sp. F1.13.3]|uniref:hypothetical protein n=1 Tax=Bradyrhizobium sp. F1.13.3 TaxID=3156351 RepID=UPI0033915EE4
MKPSHLNQLATILTQDERPYRPKLEAVHVVWLERRAANVCDSSSAAAESKKAQVKMLGEGAG